MTRRRALTLLEVLVSGGLMLLLLTVVLSLLSMAHSCFARTAGQAEDAHRMQVVLARLASELQDSRKSEIDKAPTDSTQPIEVLCFPSPWDNGVVHTDDTGRVVFCKLVLYYVNPKIHPGRLYRREYRYPEKDHNYRKSVDRRLMFSLCDGSGALLLTGVDTIYYKERNTAEVDLRFGYRKSYKTWFYDIGRQVFVWN